MDLYGFAWIHPQHAHSNSDNQRGAITALKNHFLGTEQRPVVSSWSTISLVPLLKQVKHHLLRPTIKV
eukprot:6140497-Lingulodinium_polyedra.AAC.1